MPETPRWRDGVRTGAQPANERRHNLAVALSLAGFVLLVCGGLALVATVVLAPSTGPRATMEATFRALTAGDCEGLYATLHPDITGGLTAQEYCEDNDYGAIESIDYSITSVEITDQAATVRVTQSADYGSQAIESFWEYHLENVDGTWLVYRGTELD